MSHQLGAQWVSSDKKEIVSQKFGIFFAKQIKAQVREKAKNLAISIKIRLVFYLGSSQRSQGSDLNYENQTSIYLVSSKGSQGSEQKDENRHRNLSWILSGERIKGYGHKYEKSD